MSDQVGQRVRVVGGPWPERIGCQGTIVERPDGPEGRVYPWHGIGREETIVLLDYDPLTGVAGVFDARGWTCVMKRRSLEYE